MNLKYILPLAFLLFFSIKLSAQKEANFWFFGNRAGLDFTSGTPIPIDGELSTFEGSASISDANGILQFYTDGRTVYNRDGSEMETGLLGNPSSTQSAIIVPKPLDSNIYYIFTVGNQTQNSSNGVYYSTVDMSQNGGFGDVLSGEKNIILPDVSEAREKITSVAGNRCNTFWVITQDTRNFYAYEIDNNGINTNPVISSKTFTPILRGYLKVSPDGSLLVSASQGDNETYLYDFDSSTGQVSNERRLDIPTLAYGVEFSRDSKQLYLSTGSFSPQGGFGSSPGTATIQKFNLDANLDDAVDDINIINTSKSEIYQTNSGYRGALQLASNGKIYYARSTEKFLGVIDNPEEPIATNIIFDEEGLDLQNRECKEGLPPFIQSFFIPVNITDTGTGEVVNNQELKLCIGENKTITTESITGNNIIYTWTFDNGTTSSPISSSADLILTNIQLVDAGIYSLKITYEDICGKTIEANAVFGIDVFEAADATKPQDLIFCDTDRDGFNQFNFNAEKDAEILNGLNPNVFEVLYFDDFTNATKGTSQLPNPFQNPSAFSSQIIYARVQNKLAPNACFEITDFILSVTDLPIPTQPTPYRICDNLDSGSDTDGLVETFLLNTKDLEIYGSLDPNQYSIFYHTTQAGADTNDSSTVIDKNVNYSVTDTETVFVRIENNDNPACFDSSVSLDLIVDPLPVLKLNPFFEQCIDSNNPNPTVNLTLAEFSISETPNVTFTYFVDATGIDQITDPTKYPVQPDVNQSVYVLVTTDQNCSRDIIKLELNVATQGPWNYSETQPAVCDDFLDTNGNDTPGLNNDMDGITNFRLDKTAIINAISPPANTEVFFYEKIEDRANNLNEIDITNYRNKNVPNTSGNPFPIYYKFVSTVNNFCKGLGEFYLKVDPVPLANNVVTDIEQCDTGEFDGNFSNGSNRNIDLTVKINELFSGTGQNPNDFDVFFFTTQEGANSADTTRADYITNPNQYTNEFPASFSQGDTVTQTIYVRIENPLTGCVNPHSTFNIVIHPLPFVTNIIPPLEVCDVGSKDGDVRNGLAQNIDVSQRDIDFLNGKDPNNFTITYHKTQADLQDLNSTGINKSAYDSDPSRITLNTSTNISQENLFVRIINQTTGCVFDQSTVTIIVNPEPEFVIPTNLPYCDDDNDGIIQSIDLESKILEILGLNQDPIDFLVTFHKSKDAAEKNEEPISSPYTNANPTETIYVRIENKNTNCVSTDAFFDVIINPLPNFSVTTPQILCLNDLPFNIAVENPDDVYSYQWYDPSGNPITGATDENLDINVAGTYSVKATTTDGTNCSKTEIIVVNESNIATLNPSFVTIIDESNNLGASNNLSISIDTINNDLGPGDYQFAILNTETNTRTPFAGFQDEPLFEGIEGGIYQIIVNDKNGCVPDPPPLLVSVLQFPKFFTPNGDSQNDFWVIKGANKTFYPNSSINIFNRYGKLVAQMEVGDQGWDGTFNGRLLPSDDYWYHVILVPSDPDKPRVDRKGNFSLLRR